MAELIATIVLVVSLSGAFFIVGRKIPALLEMPGTPQALAIDKSWSGALQKVEKLVQKIPFLKNFSWSAWVEKNLSKARVLALKADNKITGYLTALHVWEEKKKNGFASGAKPSEYWSDVQKFVKTKSGLRIKPLEPSAETEIAKETDGQNETAAISGPQVPQKIQISVKDTGKGGVSTRGRKQSSRKSRSW